MDNNYLNALLQRDTDTAAGLLADQPNYTPIEEDIAPLRAQHAANLAAAKALEADVLGNDQQATAATGQKTSSRQQLKALGGRLAAALQAYAASATNPDADLASRVRVNLTDLGKAEDSTFATLIAGLLQEAQPLAKQLVKREFTAADLALTASLLARFTQKKSAQRLNVVDGSTARKTFIGLLKQNANLIKQLRTQLKPYANSATRHEVWERFVGYSKVIERRGGGGAAGRGADRPVGEATRRR